MDVPASQDSGCLTGFFGRSIEVSSIVKASAVKKKKNVRGKLSNVPMITLVLQEEPIPNTTSRTSESTLSTVLFVLDPDEILWFSICLCFIVRSFGLKEFDDS